MTHTSPTSDPKSDHNNAETGMTKDLKLETNELNCTSNCDIENTPGIMPDTVEGSQVSLSANKKVECCDGVSLNKSNTKRLEIDNVQNQALSKLTSEDVVNLSDHQLTPD